MATNNPQSTPNPVPPSGGNKPEGKNKQRFTAIIAVTIVALLAVNAVLLASFFQRGKQNAELTTQLDESNEIRKQTEDQYQQALAELEEMRSSNEELNALIDQQKEELRLQKEKIDDLIANGQNLSAARTELRKLRNQVKGYVAELNQLREQNAALSSENANLTERNDSLNFDLETERMNNAQLSSERALLVSEKEELVDNNAELARKVSIASVIQVDNIEVAGQKERRSGKMVTRRNASNIDQLQICFNTEANEVAEPGNEYFLIRVINPQGETLAIDDYGSGVFTSQATGEQIRYTIQKEFAYDRTAGSMCTVWAPGQEFSEGTFKVEIYNKGFLAGTSEFTLK